MAELLDPKWPEEQDVIGVPPDYLIAFGKINLTYNLLETMMGTVFEECAPLHREFARQLFHKLNNRDRVDLLTAFIQKNERDKNLQELLEAFVLHFNICTENRNILMHVTMLYADETISKWKKLASKDPMRVIEFHASLADLNMVANQMAETFKFGYALSNFTFFRAHPKLAEFGVIRATLPEKPHKPHTLTPYQPEEAHRADPSPPRPSGA
jgi:hypothetical protein